MSISTWSDDVPTIGDMSFAEVVAKLREMGDEETAANLEIARNNFYSRKGTLGWPLPEEDHLWAQYGNKYWASPHYEFGYLAPSESNNKPLVIVHAGAATSDTNLQNARVTITLDRFHVADYPGRSPYRILLKFSTRNQVQDKTEDLHFSMACSASKGKPANIYGGYPIFEGLNVGPNPMIFVFSPVVVGNDEDQKFLGFLESDVFRSGLQLLSFVHPAVAMLSTMTNNLVIYIAKHRKNTKVEGFNLSLGFSKSLTGYHLAEGSYIAVQIPINDKSTWQWDQWVYQTTDGLVVNKNNPHKWIPYNYLIFSISKMSTTPLTSGQGEKP
jgi:hypothetical protein